jgi:phage gp36-like protein
MAYSTVADVRLVLEGFNDPNESPDPDYTPALLSDAQIEYEISNADEEINAILRRRYAVPLPTPVPEVLKNLSVDIAAALCDMTFRGSREYASVLAPARLRYERARLILDRISTGDYPLYNEGEGPEQVGDTSIVINPYPGDILLTREVFPRGYAMVEGSAEFAELATVPIPYYPYLARG